MANEKFCEFDIKSFETIITELDNIKYWLDVYIKDNREIYTLNIPNMGLFLEKFKRRINKKLGLISKRLFILGERDVMRRREQTND